MTDDPCDCPDALAFRALMTSPAGEGIDALAATLAVWKLRAMAHDLAAASDWSQPRYPYVDGDRYSTRPLSVEEIRAAAEVPWKIN